MTPESTPYRDWGGLLSLLRWLDIGLAGALVILGALALTLVGAPLWDRERRLYERLNIWWALGITRRGPFDFELRGAEHLGAGPYVVCVNHTCRFDPVLTYHLPLRSRIMVKQILLNSPVGLNLRMGGNIGVRKGGGPAAREAAVRWLERRVSVVIFAEGTRSRSGELQPLKRGAFDIAEASGAPVLPVCIAGSEDVQPADGLRFRMGQRVLMQVLEPVPSEGRSLEEVREDTAAALRVGVETLRAELRGQGQGL